MNPLVVRRSRWRSATPLVGSFVVVAICVYYAMHHEPTWVSVPLTAFFFSLAVFYLEQVFRPKPCLMISVKGICVDYLMIGTIPWNDLSGAFLRRDGGAEHICFTLRDPEEFRVRIGRLGRVLNSARRQAGYGDFTLNTFDLGLDADVVLELIKEQIALAKDKPTGPTLKYDMPL